MSASDIQIVIGSVLAVMASIGVSGKWLLMYINARQDQSNLAEEKARGALSSKLYEEIRVLRLELTSSQAQNRLYLRRIFQLESYIHAQQGLMMPIMDGWPPA